MTVLKKLLLFIACVATLAPSAAVAVAQAQPQSLQAGSRVVARSIAELATFAEPAASRRTGGPPLDAGRVSGVGRLADSRETPVPVAAGPDVQATGRRSSGQKPDSGHVPAAEPAGWVLLVSGLAVVAGIVRRRASMAQM